MTYALGAVVTITTTVVDEAGVPTDATMAIVVTRPDGTAATTGSISHLGPGQYSVDVTADQVSTWQYEWTATGAVNTTDGGQFTVADPPPRLYSSLAKLRRRFRMKAADTEDDDLLLEALAKASRAVDQDTSRRFWLDPAGSARVFNPRGRVTRTRDGWLIDVDDIGSAVGLVVEVGYAGAWTTLTVDSDYTTEPDNALARGLPISGLLRQAPWGGAVDRSLTSRTRVRVTARWGWPEIPDLIEEATLLLAARLFRRRDSPDGIAGMGDFGVARVSRSDPDYERAVAGYRLPGIG